LPQAGQIAILATGSDSNEDDTVVEIILDAMADWFSTAVKNITIRSIAISIVSAIGILFALSEWYVFSESY
jgi:hypothetical protein